MHYFTENSLNIKKVEHRDYFAHYCCIDFVIEADQVD